MMKTKNAHPMKIRHPPPLMQTVMGVLLALLILVPFLLEPGRFLADGATKGAIIAVWVIETLGLFFLLAILGAYEMNTRWGLFVNRQNRVGLARFQFTVWTVLILGAFATLFTLGMWKDPDNSPLLVGASDSVLALLGISAGGAVAVGAVAQGRRHRTPAHDQLLQSAHAIAGRYRKQVGVDLTYTLGTANGPKRVEDQVKSAIDRATDVAQRTNTAPPEWLDHASGAVKKITGLDDKDPAWADVLEAWTFARLTDESRQGVLYSNRAPWHARLSDLIHGDEVGTAHRIDLSKVQLLAFTVLVAMGFLVATYDTITQLASTCAPGDCTRILPDISGPLVGALGIGHLGHVGGQATGGTRTQP